MRAIVKTTDSPSSIRCDTLVVPVYSDNKLSRFGSETDRSLSKQLSRLIKLEEFSGKPGQTLLVYSPEKHACKRVVLWGLGEKSKLDVQQWLNATSSLSGYLQKSRAGHVAVLGDISIPKAVSSEQAWSQLATQMTCATYRYTETLSKSDDAEPGIGKLTLLLRDSNRAITKAVKRGVAIGTGINIARELGNLPGNICTPKYLSAEARKLGRKYEKISTTVLGEKAMSELGMGSLLSVGNGSDQESQFIIMHYRGGTKKQKPHVLVGKGITFDTGGISLKPGAKMDEMKFDMCGAASAFGAIHAAAEMNLPINVTAVIAAAENMPSGRATKPGDVVTSMAGKTIEVLNTDAEGRLVLCDALHYVKRFKPASVVDMATLTGACIVALGHHATGLMSNNDELADRLLASGEQSGDRAWRLPIWDDYQKQLKSPFADLANIGGPAAGTITAACFLSQFAESYPWAHLDIAGTAWNQGGGKGASGRPVSLLCQYLINLAG